MMMGQTAMRRITAAAAITLGLSAFTTAGHATITFTTFVDGTDITNAIGQDNTIGFAYAGNKFVGSVYEGPDNFQLYQTI